MHPAKDTQARTMAKTVLRYGGKEKAADDVLIMLLLYDFQMFHQIRKAERAGIDMFLYLPSINLSDLVLDALGVPGDDDDAECGILRGICRHYPIEMIQRGTKAEAQRALNRIRRVMTEHNLRRSGKED
jgi:hypothetical protein